MPGPGAGHEGLRRTSPGVEVGRVTSPLLSPADEGDEAVRSRLDHEPII